MSAVVGAIGVNIAKTRIFQDGPKPTEQQLKHEQEMIKTFAEFFLMRLEDEATLLETLGGIYGCVISGHLPRTSCELVLKKLYCDVTLHLQSSPNKVRRGAYWVLQAMLEDETGGGNAAVKHLGADFVAGFVNAMDGEKEPRNLQIALLLLPRLVWAVPQHVTLQEDIYEISSCYFPITFTERADDPNAIRKSSLINALRNTMCTGTEFWIPFLLEKLASSLIESKLETLHSLHHALTWTINLNTPGGTHPPVTPSLLVSHPLSSSVIESAFGPFKIPQLGTIFWRFEQVQPHLSSITNALVKEIIQTTDEQVAQSAASVLTDLARFLYTAANGSPTSLPSPEARLKALYELLEIIFKHSLPHLGLAAAPKKAASGTSSSAPASSSPDSKLAAMASKILYAVTCSSSEAASLVFKRVIPGFEEKWISSPDQRSFVIRQLLNLTKASAVFKTQLASENKKNSGSDMQVDEEDEKKSGYESTTSKDASSEHPIAPYAEIIVRNMLSCCQETDAFAQDQADALEALAIISTISSGSLVPPSKLSQVLTTIYDKLIYNSRSASTDPASVGIKLAALRALLKIHPIHEQVIVQQSLMTPLWNELQTRIDKIADHKEEVSYDDYAALVASLHVLCDPSALPSSYLSDEGSESPETFVSAPLITNLVQKQLMQVMQAKASVSSEDPRVFGILLSSLSRTCKSVQQFHLVFSYVAKNALSSDENWNKTAQKWIPLLVQRVAMNVLQTAEARISFFNDLYSAFVDRSMTNLLDQSIVEVDKISDEKTQDRIAFLCNASLYAVAIVLPLRAMLQDAQEESPLTSKLYTLLSEIFDTISASSESNSQSSHGDSSSNASQGCGSTAPGLAVERSKESWAVEAFGSILNKLPNSERLESFIKNSLVQDLLPKLSDLEDADETPKPVGSGEIWKVQLLMISVKALVQTKSALGVEMVEHIISMLKNAKSMRIKHLVAQELHVLFEEKTGMPHTALLYKQRVWAMFQPILESEYYKADTDQQAVFMQATSSLLKHLPSGVMIQSTPFLLPLLITTLKRVGEAACDEAVLALLSMLQASEKSVLNYLVDHLGSVVPHLLKIVSSAAPKRAVNGGAHQKAAPAPKDSMASAAARHAAADCLKTLLQLPFAKITPWRSSVLEGLHAALDDPKRAVRKHVVLTRNEWYLVNPGKQ